MLVSLHPSPRQMGSFLMQERAWLELQVWTATEIDLDFLYTCIPGMQAFVRDARRTYGHSD